MNHLRKIRLYPGSDISLNNVRHWMNVDLTDRGHIKFYNKGCNQLWIDSNLNHDYLEQHPELFVDIEQVCFYDFFNVKLNFENVSIEFIKKVADRFPTVWFTANALPVDGVDCIRFDYLWNRTKGVFLDRQLGWKHAGNADAYRQLPLHYNQRSHKFLSLNRTMPPEREKLYKYLSCRSDGYVSNVTRGKIIESSVVSANDIVQGITVPPADQYFNQSYISIQTESQTQGNQAVFFTEKTYEHLIQGRMVLNFGACNFYRELANDGWKLFDGIDYSFDSVANHDQRFQGYLDSLEKLLNLSLTELHDLFLINQSNIEHNYKMLQNKPYYFIDQPSV